MAGILPSRSVTSAIWCAIRKGDSNHDEYGLGSPRTRAVLGEVKARPERWRCRVRLLDEGILPLRRCRACSSEIPAVWMTQLRSRNASDYLRELEEKTIRRSSSFPSEASSRRLAVPRAPAKLLQTQGLYLPYKLKRAPAGEISFDKTGGGRSAVERSVARLKVYLHNIFDANKAWRNASHWTAPASYPDAGTGFARRPPLCWQST